MRFHNSWFKKWAAGCLIFLLAVPLANAGEISTQQDSTGQAVQGTPAAQAQPQESESSSQSPQSTTPQAGTDQQQNGVTKPVGTAAAPMGNTSGVAASRPAGAVIAPAKQRRARAILIRVSIVAAAAIAVGTVVALSRASPSRPN
jgi:cytoskeletal protein RodZ